MNSSKLATYEYVATREGRSAAKDALLCEAYARTVVVGLHSALENNRPKAGLLLLVGASTCARIVDRTCHTVIILNTCY